MSKVIQGEIANQIGDTLNFDLDKRKHILPVMKILIDEMVNDLRNGLSIDVGGFGSFFPKQMGSRTHNDVNNVGITIRSEGNRVLRFTLDEDVKKMLMEQLSKRKTFSAKEI